MARAPHVLIVEDDQWFAEVCADVLEARCKVSISHDAQAAIETIGSSTPQCILLDIMLPSGNGIAFLQELRSYNDTRYVPVVLCSNVRLSAAQYEALNAFAPIFFLGKADITPERLREVIDRQLSAADSKTLAGDLLLPVDAPHGREARP